MASNAESWMRWVQVPAIGLLVVWPGVSSARAQDDTDAGTIKMQDVLVIGSVGHATRSAVHTDAIEKMIVEGSWKAPGDGDTVKCPDGSTATWKTKSPNKDGWVSQQGYVLWTVQVEADRVMMLDAAGHSLVYVNGQPRSGDPYEYGNMSLPVQLHAGDNEFLFVVSRGRVKAQLTAPKGDVFFDQRDATLPDLLTGNGVLPNVPVRGSLVVVNATNEEWAGGVYANNQVSRPIETFVDPVMPLSIRKVGFEIPVTSNSLEGRESVSYDFSLASGAIDYQHHDHDQISMTLRVRDAHANHTHTFVSDIDGSVQMYAVLPSTSDDPHQAMFLSLHGAGVEAPGQAAAYQPKDWGTIVAPTNRRKFGFDWEDWGRIDAMEVLADAQRLYKPDPNRVYLTGHSMGGHGTWQVGVQYPDRFAAIGPSAAWISFWSYAGAEEFGDSNSIDAILKRATLPSDTLALSRNYLQYGIYILHGDQDDNVPVEQARTMVKHLADYHRDFAYYERPGAGHWWGGECMDWPPMYDFFRNHVRPEPGSVRHVEFVTANPAISSHSQWVTIQQQQQSLIRSSVNLDFNFANPSVEGTTENVRRLAIDVEMLSSSFKSEKETTSIDISLDGDEIACRFDDAIDGRLLFLRDGDHWQRATAGPPVNEKHPQRAGPFKEAFNHRMVFIYGTHGTSEQNAWAQAKARYDAESFYYRGNGSVDIVSDTNFNESDLTGRNVILYGNSQTNSAWKILLKDCPIDVRNGSLRVGDHEFSRDDLACLFAYPRPDEPDTMVAVVGGTGIVGDRLTDRMPYFVSGIHHPDWFIAQPEMLTRGIDGIVGAGFFDHQWQVDDAQSGWAR